MFPDKSAIRDTFERQNCASVAPLLAFTGTVFHNELASFQQLPHSSAPFRSNSPFKPFSFSSLRTLWKTPGCTPAVFHLIHAPSSAARLERSKKVPLLCFHTLTNVLFCNSFVSTHIPKYRGYGVPALFGYTSNVTATSPASQRLAQEKLLAARAALRWVRSGMTLGLGSGSTAELFIRALGEKARGGHMNIKAVASSRRSEALARDCRIALTEPRSGMKLDLVVDGADEITPELDLLKGRGGALLREKVLAQAAQYFLVIADSSKRVARLGNSPVPVEVVPFAVPWVADRIAAIGGEPTLRRDRTGEPYRTDQQNYILDCRFPRLGDPVRRAEELAQIAGIVEHGLFLGCAHAALVGEGNEVVVMQPGRASMPLAQFSV